MGKDKNTINVKVDADIKSKLDTLAYLQGTTLQNLCLNLIIDSIDANADAIAEAEKLRSKFKK